VTCSKNKDAGVSFVNKTKKWQLGVFLQTAMSILVKGLTKTYDGQKALNNISFEVKKGEILGFLGPNGAGKTTTMKILCGYLLPDSGIAEISGLSVFEKSLEVRKKIGYMPEHNPLYLDLYVHEFLKFAGKLCGIKGNDLMTRIKSVIELTGLGPEQHKKIAMLSKGYRQRTGLAQAILHNPEVLILDEPTTGLDPNQILEIRSLIRDLGKEKTILFSSHILSEVEAIAERVVIINKGNILADDQINHLKQSENASPILILHMEKPGFDFSSFVQIPGFDRVEQVNPFEFKLYTTGAVDLRKAVMEASIQQDNPIRSMTLESSSLESVFREITQSGGK